MATYRDFGHIPAQQGVARSVRRQAAVRDATPTPGARQHAAIGHRMAAHPSAVLAMQRAAGNGAVSKLIAGAAGTPTVQRAGYKFSTPTYKSQHHTQYQDYFAAHDDEHLAPDGPYWRARAAAVLLDHDVDERGDRLREDSFAESVKGLPAELAAEVGKLADTPVPDLVELMMSYLASVKKDLRSSTIQWGPMKHGAGTAVTADLVPSGHPEGSSAGGWNPWAIALSHRADPQKSLYARGHLLNRHLGGPGLDYNMTPLTSRSGWFGANDANGIHSALAEEQLKGKFNLMAEAGPKQVKALHYEVSTVERSARPLTGVVASTTAAFIDKAEKKVIAYDEANLEWLVGAQWKLIKDLAPEDLDELWLSEHQHKGVTVPKRDRTKYGDEYVKKFLVADLRKTDFAGVRIKEWSGSDRAKLEQLYAVDLPYAGLLLDAVTVDQAGTRAGRIGKLLWFELKERLQANAKLWAQEDTYVPGKLDVSYTYQQYGDTTTVSHREIPVELPSEIDAPFWSEERKSMLND
ncbi:hypothetical protein [Amycolatopsis kentuckyensis]|uniref:hypothetical protein n=1 Tax=Amycolatopsis kentuckyensis TaxID=218823 RepID=UPI0011786E26|nr:hypothetical protein [Amycolatopsis kentuckyensis]